MIRRLLAATRYIVLLPIIGTFIAAVGLMIYETLALIIAALSLYLGVKAKHKE